MRRGIRYGIAALALMGLAATAGCKAKLDSDKLEKNIAEGIKEQLGVEVKSVECPEDVEEKKGDSFTCKATSQDGESADVVVEMLGDGNVHWKLGAGAPETGDKPAAPTAGEAPAKPAGDGE